MKPFIIVTVRDGQDRWNYDMELPTNVPLDRLSADMAEALDVYTHGKWGRRETAALYCPRKRQTLPGGATLGELGIWTGDILVWKAG